MGADQPSDGRVHLEDAEGHDGADGGHDDGGDTYTVNRADDLGGGTEALEFQCKLLVAF